MLTLVLGGARSGKSRHAQALAQDQAQASELPVHYLATARAGDAEMAARIARHQAERPAHWLTREVPLRLGAALAETTNACVLVDCLTLWLMNLLEAGEATFQAERAALLAALSDRPGHVILVANEIGLGVVPMGELSRCFVDEAGWLNQDIARLADEVVFLAAGLPLVLKGAACAHR